MPGDPSEINPKRQMICGERVIPAPTRLILMIVMIIDNGTRNNCRAEKYVTYPRN